MATHMHTNRLIHETSPYLLQHAHNPVDWFAWDEEALAAAIYWVLTILSEWIQGRLEARMAESEKLS